jgi:hypothetical protein
MKDGTLHSVIASAVPGMAELVWHPHARHYLWCVPGHLSPRVYGPTLRKLLNVFTERLPARKLDNIAQDNVELRRNVEWRSVAAVRLHRLVRPR